MGCGKSMNMGGRDDTYNENNPTFKRMLKMYSRRITLGEWFIPFAFFYCLLREERNKIPLKKAWI